MKKISFTAILIMIAMCMSSCWTQRTITVTDPAKYLGNQYEQMKGMSKTQIIQQMSVPSRTMPDGSGGEILIYNGVKKPNNNNASQTTGVENPYINFFINQQGTCYNVKTNIGDIWQPARTHQQSVKMANPNLLFTLIPPLTFFVGIPCTIWYLCNKNKTQPSNSYNESANTNYAVVDNSYDFNPIQTNIGSSQPQRVQQEISESSQVIVNSAVDANIPSSSIKNANTFVVIIANEQYQSVSHVPFANNDGQIIQKYCLQTLGIPAQNIHLRENATLNNIRMELNWLSQVCDAYNGRANIIFYYAGHGIPDESSKSAYILPIDGTGSDITTGYKVDDLYAKLGAMNASHITVFMDACFSGSKREEGMLASARGVAIKSKAGQPQGKMVVFSAAQGDETAYPNKNEGHGMFTYYLLKKLQETKGDVTLFELGDYITTNVRQQSIVLNGKSQTPTVNASTELGNEWKNWKLK